PEDVTSLSTLVARSFHPVNPYIRKCFPDTPAMRRWWRGNFNEQIARPTCHVLIAKDRMSGESLGVLCLRLMNPFDPEPGIFTVDNLTPDHDVEAYRPMIESMSHYNKRLMHGKVHFMVELFGVDYAYKGRHIGTRLFQQACAISDAAGYETFVQANANARSFYLKQGFEVKDMTVMPGKDEYEEYFLVR
ncbi:hypothetical protein BAUCODRAFT_52791, partial [Baudoinia panamericana UAMH 10762]